MFLKVTSYKCHGTLKPEFAYKSKYQSSHIVAWIPDMLFMCFLIMSLRIIKVSSTTTAFYQNHTAAFEYTNLQTQSPTEKPDFQQFQLITTKKLQNQQINIQQSTTNNSTFKKNITNQEKSNSANKTLNIMEQQARIVQKSQDRQWHAKASENAYLLERDNDATATNQHEQPIYGTWRTKARRPQTPSMSVRNSMVATAALSVSGDKSADVTENEEFQPKHVYERLPRRMSTIWPMSRDLPEQIPRPPRLTSRHPSFVMRRQYFETPFNNSQVGEINPRPFHFPFDGPMPEKFKKAEGERNEINNIQDILQQLHITGSQPPVPPMMMMPTGLHIAGSFKNLKSSGIHNFFRNKRNKKQELQQMIPIPMPLPLYGHYPAPVYGAIQTPHQRISMDQFYPFKPRSPNDINLLAMHQQLKSHRNKNKKKSKKHSNNNNNNNNNLMLQHSNSQIPFALEPYAPLYPQFYAVNVTQKPKHKRLPFKVNLDIFPVMPPLRDVHRPPYVSDETKLPTSTTRPATALRNPFVDYNPYAFTPSAAALIYNGHYEAPVFTPVKYNPNMQQLPQSSNMHYTYPDVNSQMQHHQQLYKNQQKQNNLLRQQQYHEHEQQHHKLIRSQSQQQLNSQTPYMQADCINPSSSNINSQANKPQANPIMVHLNVFPKSQKSPTNPNQLTSTNPFHNNGPSISRNKNYEEEGNSHSQQANTQNITYGQLHNFTGSQRAQSRQGESISRHDEQLYGQQYIDFEHPIIAADVVTDFSQAENDILNEPKNMQTYMDNSLNMNEISIHQQQQEQQHRNQFNFNASANVEQMATEAKTASLFRFPVENLIQFQVDDAL